MGLETGSVRNPEDRKELIPPSSVLKGQSQQGKKEKKNGPLKLQCLHVLTKWREAPSRACISTALTAGITTAPLTHAGSGDTTAPC